MSIPRKFEGRWIFENLATGRYLFASDKPAGPDIHYPLCVGADANYLGRAVWKIIQKDCETYYIKNEATGRYLYQTGDKVDPDKPEGGWGKAPKTVTADDQNLYQVIWKVVPDGEAYFLINVHTDRYALQTGQQIEGDHGDEEGWANAPKVVGADCNYYGIPRWKLIKQ